MTAVTLGDAAAQGLGGLRAGGGIGGFRGGAMGGGRGMQMRPPMMGGRGMRVNRPMMGGRGMQARPPAIGGRGLKARPPLAGGRGVRGPRNVGKIPRVGRVPGQRIRTPRVTRNPGTRRPIRDPKQAGTRRPGRHAATDPKGKPPAGCARGRCPGEGKRPDGKPPKDGTHHRGLSRGDGHQRHASGGGHHRRLSYGDGHRRRISQGRPHHYRRGSYVMIPPFTAPVPPPYVDPPPSAPPVAGGGGQPPRSGGGQAAPPPPRRATVRAFTQPGQTRYAPDQVICVLRDDLTEGEIDQFLQDNGMRRTGAGGDVRIGLLGLRVFRFQITDGSTVPAKIASLQNDPRGISVQANIAYDLAQLQVRQRVTPMVRTASGLARPSGSYSMQYVIAKLNLRRAHERAKGERVLVAVIDSGVDLEHPALAGTIVKNIDVTETRDRTPHLHGTAMTGAIVAQEELMGVAPAARVIAIRAFSPRSKTSGSGTTIHIALAIDRAAQEGARIINLSLAGGHDPMIQAVIEEAYARGIVIVAAAGNNGPSAPAAYPAAYPQVIAVTATDHNDRIYTNANRGKYIAVAAPGVDIMVVAPGRAVGITTGTSVAAAHVSGVIALMLSRNPMLDPEAVRELLIRSVRAAGGDAPREEYGAGLADAYEAIVMAEPTAPTVPVAGGGSPPR